MKIQHESKFNDVKIKQINKPQIEISESIDLGSKVFKYTTSKEFKFELEDGKRRQFGVMYEIIDMNEASGGAEFKNYPYVVTASIMVDKPNKRFYEGQDKPDRINLLIDCHEYMGGVPVDHILLNEIGDANEIFEQFKINEAMLVSTNPDFGTYAAQYGKDSEFNYLQFKTIESAEKFIELLIKRSPTLATIIGFILDRPINMVGDTGWNTLNEMIKNK